MTSPPSIETLQRLADDLAEHCDSVRIVVTLPTADGTGQTRHMTVGAGNFYAQLGSVRDWLIDCDAKTKAYATMEEEEGED